MAIHFFSHDSKTQEINLSLRPMDLDRRGDPKIEVIQNQLRLDLGDKRAVVVGVEVVFTEDEGIDWMTSDLDSTTHWRLKVSYHVQ